MAEQLPPLLALIAPPAPPTQIEGDALALVNHMIGIARAAKEHAEMFAALTRQYGPEALIAAIPEDRRAAYVGCLEQMRSILPEQVANPEGGGE